MNQNQKRILMGVIAIVVAMLVYPPFQVIDKNGAIFNMGYDWLLDPPKRGYATAIVNVSMLFIQWVGLLVVGGIAFFLVKTATQDAKGSRGVSPSCNALREPEVSRLASTTEEAVNVRTLKSNTFLDEKQEGSRETPADKGYAFEDNPQLLVKCTLFVLWALVAVILIAIFFEARQINLLENISTITIETAETNDKRVNQIGTAQLIMTLITSTLFFVWQYRTNKNCHGFKAQGMRFTPGWAVGWNFVPFMNLFRPYQVMQEIWKVSTDPNEWQYNPASALVKWWWFFSLTGSFIGSFTFKLIMRSDQNNSNITDLVGLTYVSIVNDCAMLVGWIMTIWLVIAIRDKQNQLVKDAGDF